MLFHFADFVGKRMKASHIGTDIFCLGKMLVSASVRGNAPSLGVFPLTLLVRTRYQIFH